MRTQIADVSASPDPDDRWVTARISTQSRVSDDLWQLDVSTAGQRADQSRVNWRIDLPDGARISAVELAGLIRTAKCFLWTMANDPPHGRKRYSPLSVRARAVCLKVLLAWMATDGLATFAEVEPAAVERFTCWLRERQSPCGRLAPQTIVNYLVVLKDLYRQRAKLADAPIVDPLPHETTYEAAGATRNNKGTIAFIPDPIAIDLLSKALEWVEKSGDTIVAAESLRSDERRAAIARGCRGRQISTPVRQAIQRSKLSDPIAGPLDSAHAIRKAAAHLAEACFIVIAGFVGMRASEILSMKVGAIEHHSIGTTRTSQAYIAATLFKTVDSPAGRPDRWLAPAPVVRAVELLEQLSAPLRKASGRNELFLVKNTQYGEIAPVTTMHIGFRVNRFAQAVGVPLHNGHCWHFSTHQFRKTFARFVARRDRSQLLGLAEHFKHASVAMTARGYVGSDFDLHQLIDHESRAETADALDSILGNARLGGQMGKRIAAGNARFRGRAGEQVRRDYIEFILKETDLRLYACDYGWCVFQSETARCGGTLAPDEAGRSPATCLGCANMVVDERHAPYWQDRRARNLELRPRAMPMMQAVLDEAIQQCDTVLRRLGGQHDEET